MSHPFVRGLEDGSLDEAAFRFYIRQDYLFLIDYARLLSIGAARAPRLADMQKFAALACSVLETEMDLHRTFAASWGVDDLHAVAAGPATAAYCNFLLRVASLGDYSELAAAVLPCMWTYAEIGAALSPSSDRYRDVDRHVRRARVRRTGGVGAVDRRRGLRPRRPYVGRVHGVLRARGQVLGRRVRSTRASPRRSVTFAPSKCSR